MPGCIYLTADGMVEVVKRLHERKGNVNQLRLRLHGLCNIKKDHLDVLNSFLCKDGLRSKSLVPSFYGSNHLPESINSDDGRPIDVDICPMCRSVRLVFDCTRDECRSEVSLLLSISAHNTPIKECAKILFVVPKLVSTTC